MQEHPYGGDEFDARADDEREERADAHEQRLARVALVVEQFAQHGPEEGTEDDAQRREEEEPGEDAHRGAYGSGARAAEPPGHPCGQKIVDDAHCDGDRQPGPERRAADRRVGGQAGAHQPRIAQHDAGQRRNDAADDTCDREDEGQYREGDVHVLRNGFFCGERPGAGKNYRMSRLVSVSGKTIQGRNALASSKSISA